MMRYAELASAHRSGRGTVLLLDHCARIGRLMGPRAESARSRLEATLGDELTRSLLGSLCGPGQARGRS